MQVERTHLPGVLLITPVTHEDERGSFTETYNERAFGEFGVGGFVQDNRSVTRKGFIRGMHFQLARPQAKLVRAERGDVQDIVVDLRLGSPMFGRYLSVRLAEDDGRMLFVPRGFAHGFLTLSPWATVIYKVDDYYSGPDDQKGIRWDDSDLLLPWDRSVPHPQVNAKDAALPCLADLVDEGSLSLYTPEPAH